MNDIKADIVPQSVGPYNNNIIAIKITFLVCLDEPVIGLIISRMPDLLSDVELLIKPLNHYDLLLLKYSIKTVSNVIESQVACFWMKKTGGKWASSIFFGWLNSITDQPKGFIYISFKLLSKEPFHNFKQFIGKGIIEDGLIFSESTSPVIGYYD